MATHKILILGLEVRILLGQQMLDEKISGEITVVVYLFWKQEVVGSNPILRTRVSYG